MHWRLVASLLLLLCTSPGVVRADVQCYDLLTQTEYPYCSKLSLSYALHWKLDLEAKAITFGIVVDGGSWEWIGLGLSEGGMLGADLWVAQHDKSTSGGSPWQVGDYWSVEEAKPLLDGPDGQDVTLVSVSQNQLYTVVVIQRALDTCKTSNDIAIYNDTDVIMVYAYGSSWGYHGPTNRGTARVRLVPAAAYDPSAANNASAAFWANPYSADPSDLKAIELTFPKYTVPSATTTYACVNFEVPSDQKRHVIRFGGVLKSAMVHHLVLSSCSRKPDLPLGKVFLCPSVPAECSTLYAIWAMGFGNASLPVEAGLPMGTNSSTYFTLQIHYNNPQGLSGQVDSSGMALYYTSHLRPNDMGYLLLGSENINVPPGQSDYSIPPNLCPSACTKRIGQPLNLFTNAFHMHAVGHTIITRHIRNGTELQPLGWRHNFNMNWQYASSVLPDSRVLLPGDELITTCSYNTTGRTSNTTMGLSSQDEMCFNFLMYWPAVPDLGECMTKPWAEVATCTTSGLWKELRSLGSDEAVANRTAAMIAAGQLVEMQEVPEYIPYVTACLVAEPVKPIPYHTGAVVGAVVAITLALLFVAFILYQKFAKYEDPERLKLLADIQDYMKCNDSESTKLQMVASGDWGEMKSGDIGASGTNGGSGPREAAGGASLMFPKFTSVNTK